MIDISCKFYRQKNNVYVIYILHQLSCGHNQTPKVASNMQRELPRVALPYHLKIRENKTCGVVFTVNRLECLMENKNIVKTFCGGCKKPKGSESTSRIHKISESKKVNKLW